MGFTLASLLLLGGVLQLAAAQGDTQSRMRIGEEFERDTVDGVRTYSDAVRDTKLGDLYEFSMHTAFAETKADLSNFLFSEASDMEGLAMAIRTYLSENNTRMFAWFLSQNIDAGYADHYRTLIKSYIRTHHKDIGGQVDITNVYGLLKWAASHSNPPVKALEVLEALENADLAHASLALEAFLKNGLFTKHVDPEVEP